MDRAPAVHVLGSAGQVERLAAELIGNRLRTRPSARLLLPTGRSPLGVYGRLRAAVATGRFDFSAATLLQLDAYCGLGASDPLSYRHYLATRVAPLGFGSVRTLAGDAEDPAQECARYQAVLDEAPVTLAVLGVGANGHVAFNEPGSLPNAGTRRVALDEATRNAAAEDFGSFEHVPTHALTVGLATLLSCREVLLLATGERKTAAVARMLTGAPGADCPASWLRAHPRLTVLCDAAAARRL